MIPLGLFGSTSKTCFSSVARKAKNINADIGNYNSEVLVKRNICNYSPRKLRLLKMRSLPLTTF